MPLNEARILVVCDNTQLKNELASRIARAHGEVIYAANEPEAIQRLEQSKFAAAVVAQQSDTDAITARLRENKLLCCVLDTASAKPVNVPAPDTVAVYDVHLVVPTLQALLTRRQD